MKITRIPARLLAVSAISLSASFAAAPIAMAEPGVVTHSVSPLLPGSVFSDSAVFFNLVRESTPLDELDIVPSNSAIQIVFAEDTFAVGFSLEKFLTETLSDSEMGDEEDSSLSVTFLDAAGNMLGFQRVSVDASGPQFFGAIYTQPFRSVVVQSTSSELIKDLRYSVKPCMQY